MTNLDEGHCRYLIPPTYTQCGSPVKPPRKHCSKHSWDKRLYFHLRHRWKIILEAWKVIVVVSVISGPLGALVTWYAMRSGATRAGQKEMLSKQQEGFAKQDERFSLLLGEISLRNIEDELNRKYPMGYTLIVVWRKTIVPYTRRQPDWLQVSWSNVVIDEITDDYILLYVPLIVDNRSHWKLEQFDFICERTPGAKVRQPRMPIFGTISFDYKDGIYSLSSKLIKDSNDLVVVAFVLEVVQK